MINTAEKLYPLGQPPPGLYPFLKTTGIHDLFIGKSPRLPRLGDLNPTWYSSSPGLEWWTIKIIPEPLKSHDKQKSIRRRALCITSTKLSLHQQKPWCKIITATYEHLRVTCNTAFVEFTLYAYLRSSCHQSSKASGKSKQKLDWPRESWGEGIFSATHNAS